MRSHFLFSLHYKQHGQAFSCMHPAHLDFAFYRVGSQKTWQRIRLSRYIVPSIKGKFTLLREGQTSHYNPHVRFPENHCLSAPRHTLRSVQFRPSVVSNSLRPHGLQHARPPCPSPTLGARSNSCPLSRWCHPTISSTIFPFSSCLHSFPASGSFPMSQFFASDGQSTGVPASASVLPMNIQDINMSHVWGLLNPVFYEGPFTISSTFLSVVSKAWHAVLFILN